MANRNVSWDALHISVTKEVVANVKREGVCMCV